MRSWLEANWAAIRCVRFEEAWEGDQADGGSKVWLVLRQNQPDQAQSVSNGLRPTALNFSSGGAGILPLHGASHGDCIVNLHYLAHTG